MSKCKKCGEEVNGKFCSNCGEPAPKEETACPKCGEPHLNNSKFCANCGYSYIGGSSASPIKGRLDKGVAFVKEHKKPFIVGGVGFVLALTVLIVLIVTLSNIFRASKVNNIELGFTKEQVEKQLGEPDEKEDWKWEYYGGDYGKLLEKQAKLEAELESATSDSKIEKIFNEMSEIDDELENLEYPYIAIYFDEDGKVEEVKYNACETDNGEEQEKILNTKKSEVIGCIDDEGEDYCYIKYSAELYFEDGSYILFRSSGQGTKSGYKYTVEIDTDFGEYAFTIEANAHKWVEEPKESEKDGCTVTVTTSHICSVCKSRKSDEQIVKQHDLGEDFICANCGVYVQYKRDGNYIYFGEYPQTIKDNGVTITETINDKGYYLGSDGEWYAKVTATPYSSSYTFSTGEAVTNGSVYYFKVEPIKWRILSESDGTALILCDSIIANGGSIDNGIEQWLTNEFYETAFDKLQKEMIFTRAIHGDYQNRIFNLRLYEVCNDEYGFKDCNYDFYKDYVIIKKALGLELSNSDTARRMLTSDYSRATGAYMNITSSYYGNGCWPVYDSFAVVDEDGKVFRGGKDFPIGVVPALQIYLQ